METYQTVNGHELRTVILRPITTEDKAMVENMEVKESIMTELGRKDDEMQVGRSTWTCGESKAAFYRETPAINIRRIVSNVPSSASHGFRIWSCVKSVIVKERCHCG